MKNIFIVFIAADRAALKTYETMS